jgi:hypothetical protein
MPSQPSARACIAEVLVRLLWRLNWLAGHQVIGLMIFVMSNVVRTSFPATSDEVVEKLIKAGYLRPALRHDSKAIASAIARMKQDLRGQANDGEGRTAA